jgi:hypothetical protein
MKKRKTKKKPKSNMPKDFGERCSMIISKLKKLLRLVEDNKILYSKEALNYTTEIRDLAIPLLRDPEHNIMAKRLILIAREGKSIAQNYGLHACYDDKLSRIIDEFEVAQQLWESHKDNEIEDRGQSDMPGRYRTEPISQTELASIWGGGMTQKKISSMIQNRLLRAVTLSRQSYIFDNRDLPSHVIEKLKQLR